MKYGDLLARPWSEMNCGQAAAEGLRRMGMLEAARHVPVDQDSAVAAMRSGAWIETASEERGDLIVTSSEEEDAYGVALVLNPTLVLTSTRGRGVHCAPRRKLRGVQGAFRWGGPR